MSRGVRDAAMVACEERLALTITYAPTAFATSPASCWPRTPCRRTAAGSRTTAGSTGVEESGVPSISCSFALDPFFSNPSTPYLLPIFSAMSSPSFSHPSTQPSPCSSTPPRTRLSRLANPPTTRSPEPDCRSARKMAPAGTTAVSSWRTTKEATREGIGKDGWRRCSRWRAGNRVRRRV